MLVIFYLGLISAQSACNIRIIYSEKTIGLLRIKMDVFFFCRFIDIVSSREPQKKLEKLNKFIWKSHLDLSVGNCVLWMNTTVAHKLLFHLMASKEAIFIKTAFGSLDASGEITLHKLDLNFLYRKGSCFFPPCSSRKESHLPRSTFKLTGALMQHLPPVTVTLGDEVSASQIQRDPVGLVCEMWNISGHKCCCQKNEWGIWNSDLCPHSRQ